MCDNCGCGHVDSFKIIPMQAPTGTGIFLRKAVGEHGAEPADESAYTHLHDSSGEPNGGDTLARPQEHSHDHFHLSPHATQSLPVHLPILAKNDRLAERNRGFLQALGVFAINIVSSPGSGKTTFLSKTLETLELPGNELPAAVIVGDLETSNDAVRLRGKGAPVVQVTTGTVCHLDAQMVARSLQSLDLANRRLLFIENVGNLVCPASYDLGESMRAVLISVTEGEDKPLKYPPIFRGAKVVIISKIDLVAATGFDLGELRRNIQAVAPEARILEVSARTGEGMEEWVELLRGWAKAAQQIRGNCSPEI